MSAADSDAGDHLAVANVLLRRSRSGGGGGIITATPLRGKPVLAARR